VTGTRGIRRLQHSAQPPRSPSHVVAGPYRPIGLPCDRTSRDVTRRTSSRRHGAGGEVVGGLTSRSAGRRRPRNRPSRYLGKRECVGCKAGLESMTCTPHHGCPRASIDRGQKGSPGPHRVRGHATRSDAFERGLPAASIRSTAGPRGAHVRSGRAGLWSNRQDRGVFTRPRSTSERRPGASYALQSYRCCRSVPARPDTRCPREGTSWVGGKPER